MQSLKLSLLFFFALLGFFGQQVKANPQDQQAVQGGQFWGPGFGGFGGWGGPWGGGCGLGGCGGGYPFYGGYYRRWGYGW